MHLKNYQNRVLDQIDAYLVALAEARDTYDRYAHSDNSEDRMIAAEYDFAKKGFENISNCAYYSVHDALQRPLPDVYIKVPTGGGKTLLACHAIARINYQYLHRQCGVVLWIVPTEQIYRQTVRHLRNRDHPYRQTLDVASGGRTQIMERTQKFTPADCENKLLILMLMLPSANRRNKEYLRLYRDSGGFDAFFPDEDDSVGHAALLKRIGNLDTFIDARELLPPQVKSSLGNVLRLLQPLIILDEGHKALSTGARDVLSGFNPRFILELSATPPKQGNIIASVSGHNLDEEEMIKLDIHVHNQSLPDWKQTLLIAIDKRVALEKCAQKYQQNSNRYIRPIALIQVERTGRDQRDSKYIHAEQVREYLIAQCAVPEQHIAIKSAERNDLADVELLSAHCPIRYIITKSALQEGWDCSFAYVLVVLSNLAASISMTQLIGRILRQPAARKTKVTALDECYVYTHHAKSDEVVQAIKQELEREGLGDLAATISADGESQLLPKRTTKIDKQFQRRFAGRMYLPQFVVWEHEKPRPLEYERDILAHLEWDKLRLSSADLASISLNAETRAEHAWSIGLSDEPRPQAIDGDGLEVDALLMTRHLIDVIPNPWLAHRQTQAILHYFDQRNDKAQTQIAANFVLLIEQVTRLLIKAKDAMAERFFHSMLTKGIFQLLLFSGDGEWRIPNSIQVRSERRMNQKSGAPLQRSLFDYVADEQLNEYEKSMALYCDAQERLLWWYRNRVSGGYALQGWKRNRIYPDFIIATTDDTPRHQLNEVMVIESKGEHLFGNQDTDYKRTLLDLCDKICTLQRTPRMERWGDLATDFADSVFRFQLVDEPNWQSKMNALLS